VAQRAGTLRHPTIWMLFLNRVRVHLWTTKGLNPNWRDASGNKVKTREDEVF
jgi:hypothetical protein